MNGCVTRETWTHARGRRNEEGARDVHGGGARWRRWWTRDVMVRIETAGGGASVEIDAWMNRRMHDAHGWMRASAIRAMRRRGKTRR